MKILQVGPVPPDWGGESVGGVATHLQALAKYLSRAGHEVTILANKILSTKGIRLDRDRPSVYEISFSKLLIQRQFQISLIGTIRAAIQTKLYLGSLASWKAAFFRTLQLSIALWQFDPDIIHVHHLESRFPHVWYMAGNKVPIVTSVHSTNSINFGPMEEKIRYRGLIRKNLNLCPHLIFVAKNLKVEFNKVFESNKGRIHEKIIYNPVDQTDFFTLSKDAARREIKISSRDPIILYVGALTVRKNVSALIRAIALLKDEEIIARLVVVGHGPLYEELKALSEQIGVLDQVSFRGWIKHSELLYYYNAADLFALASLGEGFPLVVIEALVCGCPVLGTETAVLETVEPGVTGFIVKADDRSIAESIKSSLNIDWDRERISDKTISRFGWEASLPNFMSFYREVISLVGKQGLLL